MARKQIGIITLALAILGVFGPVNVDADAITYSTSLEPTFNGPEGVFNGPVQFEGISGGVLDPSAPFVLGKFVTENATWGHGYGWHGTPFTIDFDAPQLSNIPGTNDTTAPGHFTLNGRLFGFMNFPGTTPYLSVTFDNPTASFTLGGSPTGDMGLPASVYAVAGPPSLQLSLPETNGGVTLVMAQFQAVPEPTSAALFLVIVAGLGLRSRFTRRTPPGIRD